jgi:hypothetical protein
MEKAALVNDWKALLDIASLSHGDNAAVVTDVEDTVLLEDWTKHVLDNNRWRWVRDEARLLMKLLGEEVDTEIAVLTGLGRGGDADDLARASLQDQEIANADVMARDGDGVGRHFLRCGWTPADIFGWASCRDLGFFVLDDYFFVRTVVVAVVTAVVIVVVMMVMMAERRSVDGMGDTFGNTLHTATKGMILSVVVVIAHVTLVLWGVDSCSSSLFYSDLFLRVTWRVDCCSGGPFYSDFSLWIAWGIDCAARGLLDCVLCTFGSKVSGWASDAGGCVLEVVAGSDAKAVFCLAGNDRASTLAVLAFGGVEC